MEAEMLRLNLGIALTVLAFGLVLGSSGQTPAAFADGEGSPAACEGGVTDTVGDETGTKVVTASPGFVITGICHVDLIQVVRPQIALTVSKTADTSFIRTCDWTITKTADTDPDTEGDQTAVELDRGGGSFDVDYEVVATKTCEDSGFTVTGT